MRWSFARSPILSHSRATGKDPWELYPSQEDWLNVEFLESCQGILVGECSLS